MSVNIRCLGVLLFLCGFWLHGTCQVKKGDFFGYLGLRANFCQIDGDGASGYNKFGFSGGYTVGQVIAVKNHDRWAYLTGIEFSIRGSRRPFNPDVPGDQSFHFVYQMLDIPVMLSKSFSAKYEISAGVKTTYLIAAKDNDNFILDLKSTMRDVNMLGCLSVAYTVKPGTSLVLEGQYSLNSIRRNDNRSRLFFPTGVYHNVISLGGRIQISGKK